MIGRSFFQRNSQELTQTETVGAPPGDSPLTPQPTNDMIDREPDSRYDDLRAKVLQIAIASSTLERRLHLQDLRTRPPLGWNTSRDSLNSFARVRLCLRLVLKSSLELTS